MGVTLRFFRLHFMRNGLLLILLAEPFIQLCLAGFSRCFQHYLIWRTHFVGRESGFFGVFGGLARWRVKLSGGSPLVGAFDFPLRLSAWPGGLWLLALCAHGFELVSLFGALHAGEGGDGLLELDCVKEDVSHVGGALLKACANEVFPRQLHNSMVRHVHSVEMSQILPLLHSSMKIIQSSFTRGFCIIKLLFFKYCGEREIHDSIQKVFALFHQYAYGMCRPRRILNSLEFLSFGFLKSDFGVFVILFFLQ